LSHHRTLEGKKKKGVMIAVSWEIKAVMTKE